MNVNSKANSTAKRSNRVTVNKEKLERLIFEFESAIRNHEYARGLRDGLKRATKFENPCILDFAVIADDTENALYNYINGIK